MQKPIDGSWEVFGENVKQLQFREPKGKCGEERKAGRDGEEDRKGRPLIDEGRQDIHKSNKTHGQIHDLLTCTCGLWWPGKWAIKGNVYFGCATEPQGPEAHEIKQKYWKGSLENPNCKIFHWVSPYL